MSSMIRKAMRTIKYIWIQAENCHTAHLQRPPKGILGASWILSITVLHCSLSSCGLSILAPPGLVPRSPCISPSKCIYFTVIKQAGEWWKGSKAEPVLETFCSSGCLELLTHVPATWVLCFCVQLPELKMVASAPVVSGLLWPSDAGSRDSIFYLPHAVTSCRHWTVFKTCDDEQ